MVRVIESIQSSVRVAPSSIASNSAAAALPAVHPLRSASMSSPSEVRRVTGGPWAKGHRFYDPNTAKAAETPGPGEDTREEGARAIATRGRTRALRVRAG